MWFVTWDDYREKHKVSPGCDKLEADLIQACKQHEGKTKVRLMSSGSFKSKDALPA